MTKRLLNLEYVYQGDEATRLLKEDDSDILRDGMKPFAQMIMEVEVSSRIGASPYEWTDPRRANRNEGEHSYVGHAAT